MYYSDDGGSWSQDSTAVVPTRAQYYRQQGTPVGVGQPLLQGGTQYYQTVQQGAPVGVQGGGAMMMYGGGPVQMSTADSGLYGGYTVGQQPVAASTSSKGSFGDSYTAWSGQWRQKGSAYRVQAQAPATLVQQAPPPVIMQQAAPQPQLVWVDDPGPAVSYGPVVTKRSVTQAPYQASSGYQVYQAGPGPVGYAQQAPVGYSQTRTYYQ